MPLTYTDQNALIKLGFKTLGDSTFCATVVAAVKSGARRVVVSTWNLVETANTQNIENARKLAEFMDSLQPQWLLERYNIQELEIHEDFFRFARIPFEPKPRVGSRSAAISSLNGQKDDPKYDIPSRAFVEQWIKNPDQLEVLRKSYEKNAEALLGLRQAVKAGKITDAIRKQTNQAFLKRHMPETTPRGLKIPRELATEYVERADIRAIPSLMIETVIADNEWYVEGGADRNTLIDKFHLIPALPYVDEIVSDDAFFHTIYPVAQKSGHVRAKVIKFNEFLHRF